VAEGTAAATADGNAIDGVGATVAAAVEAGVGRAVGLGVGLGVGFGVGSGVGFGVGFGVALEPTTTTLPLKPWIVHVYLKVPAVPNVCEYVLPVSIEYGLPKEANVTLWGAALLFVQVIRSPTLMVMDDGLNAYEYDETSTIATECPAAEARARKRPTGAIARSVPMAPATIRDLYRRRTVDRTGRSAAGLRRCPDSM
jgi:hypothetical protein